MKSLFFLAVVIVSFPVFANTHTARIIKLENKSEVFVPGELKAGGLKHVRYQDEVFHIIPATLGMKLENGSILSTGPTSKVKVIFSNGDHFFVAENTQYKINWKVAAAGEKEDPSVISLIRGAFRGMVEKDGPQSGMKVKVKSTAMGVRGTDFYISEKHGEMNVSVMRGEVEVSTVGKEEKIIKVKTGETLEIDNGKSTIGVITKEDLKEIKETSTVKSISVKQDEKTEKEFTELENKATKVVLGDIKEYQPAVYKELIENKKEQINNSDTIAVATAKMLEKKAPSRKLKASESDLSGEDDPYDQYKFKKDE